MAESTTCECGHAVGYHHWQHPGLCMLTCDCLEFRLARADAEGPVAEYTPCRLGLYEHDGLAYCSAHGGFARPALGQPHLDLGRCDLFPLFRALDGDPDA